MLDVDGTRRRRAADAALHACRICGNQCGIDRTHQPGPCHIGDTAYVTSYSPHMGEEDVLRGSRGSGTIFFSGCNMHCVYCQNSDISQTRTGFAVSPQDLARILLISQTRGSHNINLVSPTHVVPHIAHALITAREMGLQLPVVYNSGGYDAPEALELMDGLVDIYMPDMKYADPNIGSALSGIRDYPSVNRAAVKEMHRQVGDLALDSDGLAIRGLLVRHLVLPEGLAGTQEVARFLADEISIDTFINVMDQYRPAYRAKAPAISGYLIDRPTTRQEYREALLVVRSAGLHRLAT